MTNANDPDKRRSRWIWEPDDIVVIKKSDLPLEKIPDQAGDNTPAADKANGGIPAQSEEGKEG